MTYSGRVKLASGWISEGIDRYAHGVSNHRPRLWVYLNFISRIFRHNVERL